MYYFLYTSSEYYDKNIILKELTELPKENNNDKCLICWLPSTNNNPIKSIKEFPQFITTCYCKPLLHNSCLNNWIINTPSCPICRKAITVQLPEVQRFNFSVCYIFFYNCANRALRAATFVSIINLFCLCFYNLYVVYYFKTERDDNQYYT